MFAFVIPVGDPARYARCAAPGIERVREPDSLVLPVPGGDAPLLRVNEVLDELAVLPDLEGVIVLHEDLVLLGLDTVATVRAALRDPEVALAGAIGATSVDGIDWWEARRPVGRLGTRHVADGAAEAAQRSGQVAALDGSLLCFGPWAVRHLRFDPGHARDFHGYDVELCQQARHHGRLVTVVPIHAHHEHRPLMHDADRWARADVRFRARWRLGRALTTRLHEQLTTGDHRGPAAAG